MFDPDKMYTSFRIEVDKGEMTRAEAEKMHEDIKTALAGIDGVSAVKMGRVGVFIKKSRGDENWDVHGINMSVEDAFKVRDLSRLPTDASWRDPKPPARPVINHGKGIQIWEEGFVIQGDSGEARLLGVVDAPTLDEAVARYVDEVGPQWSKDFNRREDGTWTNWGCRIYDNEEDARRAFG